LGHRVNLVSYGKKRAFHDAEGKGAGIKKGEYGGSKGPRAFH